MTTSSSIPDKTIGNLLQQHFDWVITALSLWLVIGLHLDAWAHHQFEVETFFTPWHGVLYSGFLAITAVLVGTVWHNYRQTKQWRQAIHDGYQLSLLGVALFMAGGVTDMLWHIIFGIEENIEALLSPTHLLLAVGGGLIVTGPLRALWRQSETAPKWATLLPALTSFALLYALLAFFTAYANPFADTIVAQGMSPTDIETIYLLQGLGIAGILLQAGLIVGVVLTAVKRWQLPFGSFSLIFTLALLLTISVHEEFRLLPIAVLAGLVTDGLYHWLKPSSERSQAMRQFAFLVPVSLYALYFAALALNGGIWWTVHLWTGAIVLAGMAGWLLSYAFIPITNE